MLHFLVHLWRILLLSVESNCKHVHFDTDVRLLDERSSGLWVSGAAYQQKPTERGVSENKAQTNDREAINIELAPESGICTSAYIAGQQVNKVRLRATGFQAHSS